jgi:hypothetical protein
VHKPTILPSDPRTGPPLWPSGQVLATDPEVLVRFQALLDFLEAVCLKRGPFSLVSTTEELFEGKISGSSLKTREYVRRRSAALTT